METMATTGPPYPGDLGAALEPGLARLIERGLLSRAELGDTASELAEWRVFSRERVTADQADTLERMLGLAAA